MLYQLTSDCTAIPDNFKWNLILYDFQQYPALYLMIVGFTVAFFLNFAVGANDAANSWSTSVGAGTVSLGWAYVLGGLFESLGVTLCSANVITRLINGIIEIDLYKSMKNETLLNWNSESYTNPGLEKEKILMIGALATLLSSTIWQMTGIYFNVPVSGSQSIVSGLIGFSLVAHGGDGVQWDQVKHIALGWVLTPLVSLILTTFLYLPVYMFVVKSKNVFSCTCKLAFSILFGLSVTFIISTVLTTGEIFFQLTGWSSTWSGGRGVFILISFIIGVVSSCMAYCCLIPVILLSEGDFSLTCYCLDQDEEDEQKNEVEVWTTDTPIQLNPNLVTPNQNENNFAARDQRQKRTEVRESLKIKRYQKERAMLLDKEMSPNLLGKEDNSGLKSLFPDRAFLHEDWKQSNNLFGNEIPHESSKNPAKCFQEVIKSRKCSFGDTIKDD